MLPITKNPGIREQITHVENLSIEQQLQLAAANVGGTLESKLAAAAVATVIARMVQLDEQDQKDLWECVKDLGSLKTRQDVDDAMKTIIEILEPTDKSSLAMSSSALDDLHPRQTHESWLVWISEKLRTLRKQQNLTQGELAERAGLPQSHISRLERGVHSPSMKTLKKLANALQVDVGKLALLSEG
jgi:DNA-binding XRE family transcriptional regulator